MAEQKKDWRKNERSPYKTAMVFASQKGLDKQLYDIVMGFMQRKGASKNKLLWAKYFVYLAVSGDRRTGPFLMNPIIARLEVRGKVYYRIRRLDEKHFEGKRIKQEKPVVMTTERAPKKPITEMLYKPHREVIVQIFKAWNSYEKALFEFLLQGLTERSLDFKPLIASKERDEAFMLKHFNNETYTGKDKAVNSIMAQVSRRFSQLFKAKMSDGKKNFEAGIVPHQLRHLRAYDQLVIKHIKEPIVMKNMNWGRGMVDYYADIGKAMREEEIIDAYEQQERQASPA